MVIQDPYLLPNGQGGVIELERWLPAQAEPSATTKFVVLCHPHPLHGGTMNNKVVTTTARALLAKSYGILRFNFRGVGQSTGQFDEGRGEVEDMATVLSWLHQQHQVSELVLAGFSFGSYIAFKLALRQPASALITLAPPIGNFTFPRERPVCPWLVVQGADDELCDSQAVSAWVKQFQPIPSYQLIPDCSHFFHGQLVTLKQLLWDWQQSYR